MPRNGDSEGAGADPTGLGFEEIQMSWKGRWSPLGRGLVPPRVIGLIGVLLWATVHLPTVVNAQSGEFEELDELEPIPGSEETLGETRADPSDAAAPAEPAGTEAPAFRQQPAVDESDGDSPEYVLRLQELEDRVNDLKEQIFRSKSRLVLLRERVLGTRIGGSQAILSHVNDMSATFTLQQVIYSLDGNQLYSGTNDDGELDDRERIQIYDGAILPGPHNVSVEMIFIGNGFGLFSYLEGYRVRVRSSYAFTAEDGKIAQLDIIAYEQGGVNQPIDERADIRYELEFVDAVMTEE